MFRSTAFKELVDKLVKYKIDLYVIQEIRWSNGGILKKKYGTLFYSGSISKRNQFGTDIYVDKNLCDKVTDFQDINPRVCKIRLELGPHYITIISAHVSTEDKEKEEKIVFL